ncbi:MAG: YggS family pyridoxal phosphate-dependent enzyme [Armatimonadetes bacterium]|nr:YggS family pyridoxal phosphate-dependent enzyme [Armatimonadota bacterium]
MLKEETIHSNIARVRQRISEHCKHIGRDPDEITVVAVGKGMPAALVQEAISNGITDIAENYIREAGEKLPVLSGSFRKHMIGHLQTNKARKAVQWFDIVQSIDTVDLASLVSREALSAGKRMDVLIQVNISREPQKRGFLPEFAAQAALEIQKLPGVSLKGLMTIPRFHEDPEAVRPYFKDLRRLFMKLKTQETLRNSMEVLSMGMSDDFLIAIEEGSTMVRIGRAIYGNRPQSCQT